jgi:small subunit ribosomal protein S6e
LNTILEAENMKLVIGDTENGKSYQVDVPKDAEGSLLGRKIGDKIDGGSFGAAGYSLQITGGSDNSGFPMRKDVQGPRKSKVLLSNSPGFNPTEKGERQARMVRGNLISDEIQQINCKVVEKGPKALAELFPNAAGKKEDKK